MRLGVKDGFGTANSANLDQRLSLILVYTICSTGPHCAVGNVSGYRCVSDCNSRGREFDLCPVPYFRGD